MPVDPPYNVIGMNRPILRWAGYIVVVAAFSLGLLALLYHMAGDKDRQMLATALECRGMPITVAHERLGKPFRTLTTRDDHLRYKMIPYAPGTTVYAYSGGVGLVCIRVDGSGRVIDAFRTGSP